MKAKMKKILTPSELEQLAGVIAEQEKKTDGEIRLVIIGRSVRGGHELLLL